MVRPGRLGHTADPVAIRVHALLAPSYANGPGARAVLWVQGCSLGCPGCFNPATHARDAGRSEPVADLVRQIVAFGDTIEGLTISGGEPLQQLPAVLTLLRALGQATSSRPAFSVIVFTGHTWEEVQKLPGVDELIGLIDVLVAGRYHAGQRVATGLRASANKTVHLLTGRYTLADLESVPSAELVVLPCGDVIAGGLDPLLPSGCRESG